MRGRRRIPFRLAAAWVCLSALLPLMQAASGGPELQTLQGRVKLDSGEKPPAQDEPLVFVTQQGREVAVYGDQGAEKQLRDPRLAERQWELEGRFAPGGRFEIVRLFTVKNGQRFRVTYYCDICHIRTHEPGRCMCCQEETELQEIPE